MIFRHPLKTFLILILWVSSLSLAFADPHPKPLLDIQTWQTSQGTPVYFVQAPELPMLDVRVIFTAGSAYDGAAWGLASLVANTLSEGTAQHNADQIATIFDQTGAQFGSDANRDIVVLSLRSLSDPKYLNSALKMFSEILSQANFSQQALERVRQQTLAAIRQQQQDPSTMAMNTFYQSLYDGHPYSHPVMGSEQTVKNMTQAQVKSFYQNFYGASNAKIILVGDLQRAEAEKVAEQLTKTMAKGKPAPALPTANYSPHSLIKAVTFPSQQTTVLIGQIGIDRQNSQYFPLTVGNYLLGGMPLNSLLFEQVRNQNGLAYGISSSLPLLSYRAPFVVMLQTRSSEKKRAITMVDQVLQNFVSKGPSPQQLQMAKQNLINNFPLNLATNDDIADALTQIAVNQRPLDYLDTYRDKISAVTSEQVTQAFQSLLAPDKMLTVTVGP